MRCDFDDTRRMDGRMDTCREIPDPKPWGAMAYDAGPDTSALHVSRLVCGRQCLRVARELPSGSGQKRQFRAVGNYCVAFAYFCSARHPWAAAGVGRAERELIFLSPLIFSLSLSAWKSSAMPMRCTVVSISTCG